MNFWPAFAASFGATLIAALSGGVASAQSGAFYATLAKPAWAPSPQIFGPVWSVLYVLIGISGTLALLAVGWNKAPVPTSLFGAQLVFNGLWTWLFFHWRVGGWAFAEIVLLWIVILANIIAFWRIRPVAGALLLPYLAWVGFAAALNFALWRMNTSAL